MADLRILIADDHQLIRRGLRDLLRVRDDWHVVAEASDGTEALALARELRPDIAILDFFMPGLKGPEVAFRMAGEQLGTRVVILTLDDSEQVIQEVLRAGAKGFVLKTDADRDLVDAVQAATENSYFLSPRVSELVLGGHLIANQRKESAKANSTARLTDRQREVMRLLAYGMTSKETASELQISIRTVESHRMNINRKLGLNSIADLVRYAVRNDIISAA
jgi:DNA-binding NarL/FixJ family response regulator